MGMRHSFYKRVAKSHLNISRVPRVALTGYVLISILGIYACFMYEVHHPVQIHMHHAELVFQSSNSPGENARLPTRIVNPAVPAPGSETEGQVRFRPRAANTSEAGSDSMPMLAALTPPSPKKVPLFATPFLEGNVSLPIPPVSAIKYPPRS